MIFWLLKVIKGSLQSVRMMKKEKFLGKILGSSKNIISPMHSKENNRCS